MFSYSATFRICICSVDPNTSKDSSRLERVWFLFSAAYILKIEHSQYNYLLIMCKIYFDTLADRGINANLTFLQKLVDGSTDTPTLLSQLNIKVPICSIRIKVSFIVTFHLTNYDCNHTHLDRMMRLANENVTFLVY